uniref:Uncharacterized protein n=1 Tax=Knipowitschia caucasica TaxID=637954 RepID=A0AAV2JJB7_KNICA
MKESALVQTEVRRGQKGKAVFRGAAMRAAAAQPQRQWMQMAVLLHMWPSPVTDAMQTGSSSCLPQIALYGCYSVTGLCVSTSIMMNYLGVCRDLLLSPSWRLLQWVCMADRAALSSVRALGKVTQCAVLCVKCDPCGVI